MQIANIAAYRFVAIADPAAWRDPMKRRADALGLKGTILIAPEGINLFLAGQRNALSAFLDFLRCDGLFAGAFDGLPVKWSFSSRTPFRRMLVRLKKEIITMRHPTVRPAAHRAPAVGPAQLRAWLDAGRDDAGRRVLLLDTRNRFEVALGSFAGAAALDIARFGDFPAAVAAWLEEADVKDRHIVTYCTGGIRCEKAALYMRELGVAEVSQLEGGILKYFEEVGAEHWRGECFVFDDRVALDARLAETATVQCYACRSVVSVAEQADARYRPGLACPRCAADEPSPQSAVFAVAGGAGGANS